LHCTSEHGLYNCCPLIRTPRLPVVDWTDTPADLNGLVRFAERPNLVSARVPSRFERAIQTGVCESVCNATPAPLLTQLLAGDVVDSCDCFAPAGRQNDRVVWMGVCCHVFHYFVRRKSERVNEALLRKRGWISGRGEIFSFPNPRSDVIKNNWSYTCISHTTSWRLPTRA